MNDFDDYNPAAWQIDGLLKAHLGPAKRSATRVTRTLSKVMGSFAFAAAVGMFHHSAQVVLPFTQSAAVVLREERLLSERHAQPDEVPDGYWAALTHAIRRAQHAAPTGEPDDFDPEPLI